MNKSLITLTKLFGFYGFLILMGCGTELDIANAPENNPPADPPTLVSPPALKGSYIMAYDPKVTESALYFTSYGSEFQFHQSLLENEFLSDSRVKDINFITSADIGRPNDGEWEAEFAPPPGLQLKWGADTQKSIVASIARVDFVDDTLGLQALAEWQNAGKIWFAEPNYVSYLQENPFPVLAPIYKKQRDADANNQPQRRQYWNVTAIKLVEAMEHLASQPALDNPKPIIAVLDSGVDYEHPRLKDAMFLNQAENVGNAGCINDLHGCNTTTSEKGKLGDGEVWPYTLSGPGQSCVDPSNCEHGTHVAGIIAAKADDTTSTPGGVCPVCTILPIRIIGKVEGKAGALDSSIIAGLKYISNFKRNGASQVRIVNASFGKYVRSRAVSVLIRSLQETNGGTLIIGAASNDDAMQMSYPAALPGAVAVASTDIYNRKSSHSNFGRWVDVSAPGVQIVSTIPGGTTEPKNGTSMAAPHVAAAAGLLLWQEPGLSISALRERILVKSDSEILYKSDNAFNYVYYYPKIKDDNFRQPLLGYGLLNVDNSLRNGESNSTVFSGLDRVNGECGVIHELHTHVTPLWFLLLPLLFVRSRYRVSSR